jgi:hypothetical protein
LIQRNAKIGQCGSVSNVGGNGVTVYVG